MYPLVFAHLPDRQTIAYSKLFLSRPLSPREVQTDFEMQNQADEVEYPQVEAKGCFFTSHGPFGVKVCIKK